MALSTIVAPQFGTQDVVYCACVLNNTIYGVTGHNGFPDGGYLLKWNGVDAWTQAAVPFAGVQWCQSLTVHNNRIFAGTYPNGLLLRYDEPSGAWEQVAPILNAQTNICSLISYNNVLYAGTSPGGRLFMWDEPTLSFVQMCPMLNFQEDIQCLAYHDGAIFGGTSSTAAPGGRLFRWPFAGFWTEVAPTLVAEIMINSLCEYKGRIYGGTRPNGKLYQWNELNAWAEVAPQLNGQTDINAMKVFDGILYAGTGMAFPNRLFRWNEVNLWVEVCQCHDSHMLDLCELDGYLFAVSRLNGYLERIGPPTGFTMTPDSGNATLTVFFDNVQMMSEQPIVDYHWVVCGPALGTAVTGEVNCLSFHTPSFTYSFYPGDYVVTLTITDAIGSVATIVKTLNVGNFCLNANPLSGHAPHKVNFTV